MAAEDPPFQEGWGPTGALQVEVRPRSEKPPPGTQVAEVPSLDELLRRHGLDKPASGRKTPSAATPVPSVPSVEELLQRHGLDEYGQPGPATPAAPAAPTAEDIRQAEIMRRARQIEARPTSGPISDFSGSAAAQMPVLGPLLQRASAWTGAALSADRTRPFADRYDIELEALRQAQRDYAEQHPGRSLAAALTGGVVGAGPVSAIGLGVNAGERALGLVGESLLTRGLQGGVGQGLIAGTDAALRGEDPMSIGGAPGGAALGFAAPAVGAAFGRLWDAGRNVWRSGSGMFDSLGQVAREYLGRSLANETHQSMQEAINRMGPHGLTGYFNPETVNLMSGIVGKAEPPASRNILEAVRNQAAQERAITEDALNRAIGPRRNIVDFANRTTEARANAADPLYQQWRSMRVDPTPELEEMIPALEELGLFRDAKEHALMQGIPWTEPATAGRNLPIPTTASWDMVKRAFDRRIEGAYARGEKTLAADLINMKNRMIDEIRRTPAGRVWDRARQAFAAHSEILNQLEAGRDTFLGGRSGTSVDQLREELRGLSQPEREARLIGLRDAAAETMGATRNGDTTLRSKMLAPNNIEKLRLLLGDAPADELVRTIEQQGYRGAVARFVDPTIGSQTAGRLGAKELLEPPPPASWDFSFSRPGSWVPPWMRAEYSLAGATEASRQARWARARQEMAPVLTAQGPANVRGLFEAAMAENVARAQVAREAEMIRQGVTLGANAAAERARLEAQRRHMRGLLGGMLGEWGAAHGL